MNDAPLVLAENRMSLQQSDWSRRDLLSLYLMRFDRLQTQRAYKNDLIQFFGTDVISYEMAMHVSFVTVNTHLQEMERSGQKPATMKRRLAAIRGFFDWLIALQLVEHNPASRQLVRRIRGDGKKDRAIIYLSTDQSQRLIAATSEAGDAAVRDRALIITLLHCVLRRSEAAAMDFEHVRSLGDLWVLNLPMTKGGADQYVKLPAHVRDEIEGVRLHYGFGSGAVWRSLSCNNSNGKRLTPHSIYDIVRKTAHRAGLGDAVGAHTLRHTGCTLALEAGASLQQVQTHARHKHIETTMRYVHQREKLRDSAADYIHIPSPPNT